MAAGDSWRLGDLVDAGWTGWVPQSGIQAQGRDLIVYLGALGSCRARRRMAELDLESAGLGFLRAVTDQRDQSLGRIVVNDLDLDRADVERVEATVTAGGAQLQLAAGDVLHRVVVDGPETHRLNGGPVVRGEDQSFSTTDAAVVDGELAVTGHQAHRDIRRGLGGEAEIHKAVAGPADAGLLQFNAQTCAVVVVDLERQFGQVVFIDRIEAVGAGGANVEIHIDRAIHELVVGREHREGLSCLPVARGEGEGNP